MAKTSLKTKSVSTITKEVTELQARFAELVRSIELIPQDITSIKKTVTKPKSKRGRPFRKQNGEKSTKIIGCTLTPSEFEILELKRHSKQMSRSKYIRECLGIGD